MQNLVALQVHTISILETWLLQEAKPREHSILVTNRLWSLTTSKKIWLIFWGCCLMNLKMKTHTFQHSNCSLWTFYLKWIRVNNFPLTCKYLTNRKNWRPQPSVSTFLIELISPIHVTIRIIKNSLVCKVIASVSSWNSKLNAEARTWG